MPEVIGILDGGSTVIKHKGRPANVGVIIFRTSNNESAPVDHRGYCRLNHKDSIIHNLRRIMWEKPAPAPAPEETQKIEDPTAKP